MDKEIYNRIEQARKAKETSLNELCSEVLEFNRLINEIKAFLYKKNLK